MNIGRRLVLLLVAALTVVAMAVVTAGPAFADPAGCNAGAAGNDGSVTGGGGGLQCPTNDGNGQFTAGGSGGVQEGAGNFGGGGHADNGYDPATNTYYGTYEGGIHFKPTDGQNYTAAGRCDVLHTNCVGNGNF